MRVHVGSDHAGYDIKNRLVDRMRERGHQVVDHGPFEYDELDDYPPFCLRTAEAVAADPGSLGVVIGGSGNGEQMAANKVRGIRAALAWSEQTAALARKHNDAQVVAFGARMHPFDDIAAFVDAFLTTPYSQQDRHTRRIDMISHYEQTGELPPLSAVTD
jgi:ribose 5-phosphate isomerase B